MTRLKAIGYGLLILMGVVFATLNTAAVSIHFYVWTLRAPLSLCLSVTFILGMCTGGLLSWLRCHTRAFSEKVQVTHSAP